MKRFCVITETTSLVTFTGLVFDTYYKDGGNVIISLALIISV